MNTLGIKFAGKIAIASSAAIVTGTIIYFATVSLKKSSQLKKNLTDNKISTSYNSFPGADGNTSSAKELKIYQKTLFVNPPIKGHDIPFETFSINNDTGATLNYKGSMISIPAGIFCDNSGITIKGKVDIKYREFHNPIDFFFSGIPMTYDSAGKKYTFESAGMFDIRGEQNGKPVMIKKGEHITVDLASAVSKGNYNTYYLDTAKKNWVFQNTNTPSDLPLTASVLKKPTLPQLTIEQLSKTRQEIENLDLNRPIAPREANHKNMSFTLNFDKSEFPELAFAGNTIFEIGSKTKGFERKYGNMIWDAFSLRRIGRSDNYYLSLTKDTESHLFVVYPVYDTKDFKTAKKAFDAKYKDYLSSRGKLLEKLNGKVDMSLLVAKEETEMAREEDEHLREEEVSKTNTFVIRRFQVNNFGIWNCDHALSLSNASLVYLTPEYKDDKNDTLNGLAFYYVDSRLNALYTLYSNQHICYDTTSSNLIWCVTRNNRIAIFSNADFKKIKATGDKYTFNLKVVDKVITGEADVKSIFNNYL